MVETQRGGFDVGALIKKVRFFARVLKELDIRLTVGLTKSPTGMANGVLLASRHGLASGTALMKLNGHDLK
jgi:hypothetical protein